MLYFAKAAISDFPTSDVIFLDSELYRFSGKTANDLNSNTVIPNT